MTKPTIRFPKPYNPETPRNVAAWAVIKTFGRYDRTSAVNALVEAGIVDHRVWNHPDIQKQAKAHVAYLERGNWVAWETDDDQR